MRCIVTYFAAPRSYTAEDVIEISCHGAPVVLRHCLERAVRAGARLAEPGEFTLRAFLNGRIDLPQAEAVRDLIDATTLYQARIAAQQTQGSVSRRLAPIKAQLLELIALLEAGIDFAEDDISVAPAAEILRRLDPDRRDRETGAQLRYGNLVRNGFSLAIAGLPNAGKSSLFNRLLEQDRAIVTIFRELRAIWSLKPPNSREFPCVWWIPREFAKPARRSKDWGSREPFRRCPMRTLP